MRQSGCIQTLLGIRSCSGSGWNPASPDLSLFYQLANVMFWMDCDTDPRGSVLQTISTPHLQIGLLMPDAFVNDAPGLFVFSKLTQ